MLDLKQFEVWFVTGSQDLYGEDTLRQVDEHSLIISQHFDQSQAIPVRVVFKPVVNLPTRSISSFRRPTWLKIVLVSSPGCTHFLLQKCG